jgi:halimadienyl-diphosphate synthase
MIAQLDRIGNVDLRGSVHRLLEEIGPGRMMSTAYDTAWIARLSELGEPVGERALDWLRAHQLADGSWGAGELRYYHDRLICTLAAMTVLARHGRPRDHARLQRAQLALETITQGLKADPAGETVGFEMIVPILLDEARALGVIQSRGDGSLERLSRYRAAKLNALPGGMINRSVTVAFSAEMAGSDGLQLLDVENLQEANGSVAHSPSATAYFVLHVRRCESPALEYLRQVVVDDAAPNVAPFDVFERAWVLWNLALAGPVDGETLRLCRRHLDFLEEGWRPDEGIGFAAGYTPDDGDDTGLVYEVLTHFGRSADLGAVLHYEEQDHFRCYALEANPSISANIHVLAALRRAGLEVQHPSVQKTIQFLRRTQTLRLFWFDKWHASPYYPTAHTVIACAGYESSLVRDAVYWILETQNPDGSWGYYMPTAEETAYCLQALVVWRRSGGRVPLSVLEKGAAWLADHAKPPYPPLWIGKCLYCPISVVRSAVLSALLLVTQE